MIRLFRVSIPSSILLLVAGDLLLLLLCYVIPAQWTQDLPLDLFLLDDYGAASIGIVIAILLGGLYLGDWYENVRKQSSIQLMQQLCLILGVELLLQSMLSYLRSPLVLSKWLMLYGGIGTMVLLPAWRRVFTHVVARRLGSVRVLFVGTSPVMWEVFDEMLDRPELGMLPLGYLDVCDREESGLPYLGPIGNLKEVVARAKPEHIVVAAQDDAHFPIETLLDLQFIGMPIERVSSVYERIFGRVSTQSLHAAEVIFSPELRPSPRYIVLQNVYSTLLAIVGLAAASPVMIVVAVLIKVTSPGPVLYRQTRVGRGKATFTLYKFRSMYTNAEADTGAVWAAKNDPRITPLGRVLRQLRLDELPQFINVIWGQMSLVGPRPERPEFVEVLEDKIPFFRQRMSVKPGITGWAQINHKYGDTLDDTVKKLEYDLYYIKNLTPSLDAYILFHTVKVMLLSRGAQ